MVRQGIRQFVDEVGDSSNGLLSVLNMFAPTRTLLHTYNRYDHHDHHDHHDDDDNDDDYDYDDDYDDYDDDDDHHHHHHGHDHITIRNPSEQYVDWGNNINFISMRDQHSPPSLNNMLIGVIRLTLSS